MARTTVSFTTCNLYNLNEPDLPMYGAAGWTQDQYEAKIAWLGMALRRMQADVYGFQELWHADSLEAAIARAGLEDTHTVLAPPGHSGQSIVCAGAVRADMLVGEPEWMPNNRLLGLKRLPLALRLLKSSFNAALDGQADLVLSDMAPNTTGHASTDHLRIIALAER
jgi:23S rRNA U2552 (ribose-2'-O)-methylase RlmE/FtsJ